MFARISALIGVTIVVVAGVGACGSEAFTADTSDENNNAVDCRTICEQFNTCQDAIDVDACTRECEDDADDDGDFEEAALACEECVALATCAEAEPCWADCPVPD